MWHHMARIIGEVRPRYAFIENSPALISRGLDRVLCDLAALGYDARWTVMGAADVGAPHKRERIWILANAMCAGGERGWERKGCAESIEWSQEAEWCAPHATSTGCGEVMADAMRIRQQRQQPSITHPQVGAQQGQRQNRSCGDGGQQWPTEPDVGRVANGVAARANRIKAIGNGQVPRVCATAFNLLMGQIK